MNFRLRELNHRQLVAKMKADLSVINRNLDILYATKNEEVDIQVGDLSNLAEYLEVFANKTWIQASDIAKSDLVKNNPCKATKAEDFLQKIGD